MGNVKTEKALEMLKKGVGISFEQVAQVLELLREFANRFFARLSVGTFIYQKPYTLMTGK